MKKYSFIHKILFVALFVLVAQLSTPAFGLSLMGPPRSILQPEESAFAVELGYSEMDLESFGDITESVTILGVTTTSSDYSKYKVEKLKSIMPSVRLDTNIAEDWDLFIRLGLSDASSDITEEQAGGSTGRQYNDFDGGFGFSLGLGTRATLYKQDNTSWGAIFQANWMNPGDSDITDEGDTAFSGNAELSYWDVQLAFGPTVEFENVRVYGGPFIHFVNGDLDITGTTTTTTPRDTSIEVSHDLKEESTLGGFVGAQWNLGNNNTLITEVDFSADAWGIGIGAAWKF